MEVVQCPQLARQCETPIHFPGFKQWLIQEYEPEESTYLNSRNARKPLAVYIPKRSEEL
jgi:hypothetical protein